MRVPIPSKEELYKLYIIENKSRNEMLGYYNISLTTFKRWCKLYNIIKPQNLVKENREKACEIRYGCKNYGSTPEFKQHIKQVCTKRTKEEQNLINTKRKNYVLDKYKVNSVATLPEVQAKTTKTCNERYGGIGYASKELREKSSNTLYNRFGVYNPSQCPELQYKKYITQEKNKTFNKSKAEDYIFSQLLSVFPNTKRQYSSELYPFPCDFYIPEFDLYIEYQGFFSHGNYNTKKSYGPYDPNNPEHKKILKEWQIKADQNKPRYKTAIHTWTVTDPLKRKIVKEKNLNWIEFFTLEQFNFWFNYIKDVIL